MNLMPEHRHGDSADLVARTIAFTTDRLITTTVPGARAVFAGLLMQTFLVREATVSSGVEDRSGDSGHKQPEEVMTEKMLQGPGLSLRRGTGAAVDKANCVPHSKRSRN